METIVLRVEPLTSQLRLRNHLIRSLSTRIAQGRARLRLSTLLKLLTILVKVIALDRIHFSTLLSLVVCMSLLLYLSTHLFSLSRSHVSIALFIHPPGLARRFLIYGRAPFFLLCLDELFMHFIQFLCPACSFKGLSYYARFFEK